MGAFGRLALFISLPFLGTGVTSGHPDDPSPSGREVFVQAGMTFDLPQVGISPNAMGVVVNRRDPESAAIAAAYIAAHGIPPRNLVEVDLPVRSNLTAAEANEAIAIAWGSLPAEVQGMALAWSQRPYRVEGQMSITTAFAIGGFRSEMAPPFSPEHLLTDAVFGPNCFDVEGGRVPVQALGPNPRDTFGFLPTMLLAGWSFEESLTLIERSASAFGTFPEGALAAFVRTYDRHRDVRSFDRIAEVLREGAAQFGFETGQYRPQSGRGWEQSGVLFHFSGATRVREIDQIAYVPGALGDHLTSFAGDLDGAHDQMRVLDHLRQGASGSYGTVAEPGNAVSRFPDPEIVVSQYLSGRTLLQAYWSSVSQPGYGLFVGDPLARPFAGVKVQWEADRQELYFPSLVPGRRYRLWGSEAAGTAETLVQTFTADSGPQVAHHARGADHAMPELVHQGGWTSVWLPREHPWRHFRIEEISEERFLGDVEARALGTRLLVDSNAPMEGYEYSPWYGWIYTELVHRDRRGVARGWIYSPTVGWQFVQAEAGKSHLFTYDLGDFGRLQPDFSIQPLGEAGWSYVTRRYFESGCWLYNYSRNEWIQYIGYEAEHWRAHMYAEPWQSGLLTRRDAPR